MSKAPNTERFTLNGPIGGLEAVLESPADGSVSGAVVVCHPHPLHGGTMLNKVAHTLARGFIGQGFAALRFNFRGAGRSDGGYDGGVGEVDDALSALRHMGARYPDVPLWIAGFSFGAAVAVKAAAAVDVAGLISVAPAIQRFAAGLEHEPQCPWLVVQGDQDELVDIDDTVAWVDSLRPGPELLVLPDAEHFFHGRLIELRDAVADFVNRHGDAPLA